MPNQQQLREWYKKFSAILLEKAAIDVNSPEDLGRVKNIQITKWDTTNPNTPDVKVTYAYAPHKDKDLVNPFSDTATKRDHAKWINENLKPDVTDDQILQLYNMSHAGTLMITSPTAGLDDIQMVRTDANGNITTSLPASAYRDGKNETLPEKDQIPRMPERPDYSLNPEDYNIAPRPVAPPEPANMDPSIWAIIGYFLFNLDNDYAKLRQYKLDKIAYDKAVAKWDRDAEHAEPRTVTDQETGETRTIAYDDYRIARNAHQLYSEQFETYQTDPMAKFNAIATSAKALANQQFWQDEQSYLKTKHDSSPRETALRETALKELNTINERLSFEERTDTLLHNWLGYNGDSKKTAELLKFRLDNFQLTPMDLPKSPNFDQMTETEQADHIKEMTELFDFAGIGAISLPEIIGTKTRPGWTEAESARNRFGHVLNDMITHGRTNATEYFMHVNPAREKALEAMQAYCAGDKSQLGKLLGSGMRELLWEGAMLNSFTDHALNTTYLIGKMYTILKNNPDLLQASGLKAEEMEEARANMELYQIMRQGLQAKKDILDHAFENHTLNAEQLQKAAGDVLLLHYVISGMEDGKKSSEKTVEDTDEYQRLTDELVKPEIVSTGIAPGQVQGQKVEANAFILIKNRLVSLMNFLPANQFTMRLLNKNWVNQYKQGILETANLSKIGEMSRKELRNLFGKNNGQITTALTISKPASAPTQKVSSVQKEVSAQKKKESAASNKIG